MLVPENFLSCCINFFNRFFAIAFFKGVFYYFGMESLLDILFEAWYIVLMESKLSMRVWSNAV